MQISISSRIEADIEQRILSGAWPPGSRIPYEHVLMQQYDCSRMTVSKALSGMSARGLIIRRRRAGSFVARPAAERSILKIEDFAEQARNAGQTYRHMIHHRMARPLHRGEASALDIPPASHVLEIHCLHELDAVPVAWEERLIVIDRIPAVATETFLSEPPGSWLLQHIPWTEAEHVISALNAGALLAGRLGIDEGDACLELHRRTWLQGALVTDVRLIHSGARYRFSGRFSPTGAD